jgi:tetratricopeptide (TPR) repeat protein
MRYKGSSKPLPEIARELDVEGVVEGSVVRSGGRVRITAQLVHAPTDRHLWAHSYERRLEDVLVLQGDVSRAIAEEVRIAVGTDDAPRPAHERAVNPDAYDAYLLGRHHWNERNPQSLDKAIDYFRSAIAQDPAFAPAHAGLALAYGPRLVYGDVPPGPALAGMKAEALKALELDPTLGEPRVALAAALGCAWDWEAAERQYRMAVQGDPNSAVAHLWYAAHLHAQGRFQEGLAQERAAMALDPLDVAINRSLARDLDATGQVEASLAQWTRTLELGPDHLRSQLPFALFLLEHGHPERGLEQLDHARALRPDNPSVIAGAAIASAMRSRTDEAHKLLDRLTAESVRRYISPVIRAYVHAALGERAPAFVLLEKAYAAKDPLLAPLQTLETQLGLRVPKDPAAALRADPRYQDLLRRMGIRQ